MLALKILKLRRSKAKAGSITCIGLSTKVVWAEPSGSALHRRHRARNLLIGK